MIFCPHPSTYIVTGVYALRGQARTSINYLFLLLYTICFWNCCTQCYFACEVS